MVSCLSLHEDSAGRDGITRNWQPYSRIKRRFNQIDNHVDVLWAIFVILTPPGRSSRGELLRPSREVPLADFFVHGPKDYSPVSELLLFSLREDGHRPIF